MDSAAPRPDSETLRLESDAQAVQIVTVHKSKGLEYPIVFCPFTWESGIFSGDAVLFHDPEHDDQRVLDLGSPEMTAHERLARKERLAENVRLLYVALTRAKYRCYLAWGRINRTETSAPAYLFHGGADSDDGSLERVADTVRA